MIEQVHFPEDDKKLFILLIFTEQNVHASIISTSLFSGVLLTSLQKRQWFLNSNTQHLASVNHMSVEISLKKYEINRLLPQ